VGESLAWRPGREPGAGGRIDRRRVDEIPLVLLDDVSGVGAEEIAQRVVCSVVGGRLAGILAAVVGGLIAWYLWLPPRGTFSLEWPDSQLTIILYVVTSTILLLLTRGLNETLKELEKERDLSAELFRELQHRTANNLQNVSALLRQNREAIRRDPGKAVDVVESAERRFEIMSRINRRLYNPEMEDVEATPLLEALCQDILALMGNNNILVVVSLFSQAAAGKGAAAILDRGRTDDECNQACVRPWSPWFGRNPPGSEGEQVSPDLRRRRQGASRRIEHCNDFRAWKWNRSKPGRTDGRDNSKSERSRRHNDRNRHRGQGLKATAGALAFLVDIDPIDAHGGLPTRQCKAAVLQKNSLSRHPSGCPLDFDHLTEETHHAATRNVAERFVQASCPRCRGWRGCHHDHRLQLGRLVG
jgi:hypothetical protein